MPGLLSPCALQIRDEVGKFGAEQHKLEQERHELGVRIDEKKSGLGEDLDEEKSLEDLQGEMDNLNKEHEVRVHVLHFSLLCAPYRPALARLLPAHPRHCS